MKHQEHGRLDCPVWHSQCQTVDSWHLRRFSKISVTKCCKCCFRQFCTLLLRLLLQDALKHGDEAWKRLQVEYPLIAPVLESARQIALTLNIETFAAIWLEFPGAHPLRPQRRRLPMQLVNRPRVTVLNTSFLIDLLDER